MKKYKLIKEYPSLPKNWKSGLVMIFKSNNWYLPEDKLFTQRSIHAEEIEKYPEFWEEVKEKEWEILEFKSTEDVIFKLRKNGDYWFEDNTDGVSLGAMLNIGRSVKSGAFSIHSIKRLSDGEVFTVGDTIYCPNILQNNETVIVSFELKEDRLLVKSTWHTNGTDLFNIKKTEKREPILKTEDEKNLYEGDQYWTVFNQQLPGIEPFKIYGPHIIYLGNTFMDSCKFFSTKERAEKYIQENKPKPLFRTEDGVDIFSGSECWYVLNRNSFAGGDWIKRKRKCNGRAQEGKYFYYEENADAYLKQGHKILYGVDADFKRTREEIEERVQKAFPAGNWKWFNSEKERDLYIEENKPRFSMKDMMSFGKYVGGRTEFTTPLQMFYDWANQPRKK